MTVEELAALVIDACDAKPPDMSYVEKWCSEQGTSERLRAALDAISPL